MCFRLLPVNVNTFIERSHTALPCSIQIFELVISRMFEHMPNTRIVEAVLQIGHTLFRAHGDRRLGSRLTVMIVSFLAAPMTFLYNTLFVYEKKLRERSAHRQSLILGMIGTGILKERSISSSQRFV
jgi:hypothetical protein